ncbi:MAG: collagen-like protein [Kofleriaceae bacterium]
MVCSIAIAACNGSTGGVGPEGENGANGADGTNGVNGANGSDGAAGAKGDKGDKGDPGVAGASAPILLATAPEQPATYHFQDHDPDGLPANVCVSLPHQFKSTTGRVLIQRSDRNYVWYQGQLLRAVSKTSLQMVVDARVGSTDTGDVMNEITAEANWVPWDYSQGACDESSATTCETHKIGTETRCYCGTDTCPMVDSIVVTELPAIGPT